MITEQARTRLEHAIDSRSVAVGVWLYRRTKGRITRPWHRRAIILTTRGRRTARPRTVLVQAFPHGSDLYVVAANSGLPHPPGWYFNLVADPRVVAEFDGQVLHMRAELLTADEAGRLWRHLVLAVAPDYEKYARRLGRVPPMFRLVPD
jgi:deazaflavin-dependent oxidoreductase (nitroreductase family)